MVVDNSILNISESDFSKLPDCQKDDMDNMDSVKIWKSFKIWPWVHILDLQRRVSYKFFTDILH